MLQNYSFNIPNSCLNVQPSVLFGYITRSQPCTHTHTSITSWAPQGGARVGARPPPPGKSHSHFFCYMGGLFATFFCAWGA